MTDRPVVRDPSTEDQWLRIHRLADSIAEILLTIPEMDDLPSGAVANAAMPYIQERVTSKRAQPVVVVKHIRNAEGDGYHDTTGFGRVPITKFLRRLCYMRDGWRCMECGHTGSPENPLTLDHIVPVVKGGLTIPENLQTYCWVHNGAKGDL